MKAIDLLNKIANGEEVPKKIKYLTTTYTLRSNGNYYGEDGESYYQNGLYYQMIGSSRLNEEVEIIEEDKKIEKIDLILDEQFSNDELQAYIKETQEKVNEIIDYLEENKND